YILMNVECGEAVLDELTTTFRYNDAILRHLVIRTDEAITEESPIMKAEKESRERKARAERRQEEASARAEAERADEDESDEDLDDSDADNEE
ncbi:MAG TPA: 30S ribosomal protein S6, partial [Cellvibrionaceae bacterium]|nr:30S ribosomal protein S6 [Cellvibrionaceae bacterium]